MLVGPKVRVMDMRSRGDVGKLWNGVRNWSQAENPWYGMSRTKIHEEQVSINTQGGKSKQLSHLKCQIARGPHIWT